MMKIKYVPYIFYILAMVLFFGSIFIFKIIDYEINEKDTMLLFLVVESCVTIGLLISLIIKIKLKEVKNRINRNIFFLIGFIYTIIISLSDLITPLKKVVDFLGIIAALLIYLLIILVILFIIYSKIFKRNRSK